MDKLTPSFGIVQQFLGKDLDRDRSIQVRVCRAVHDTHAAFADFGHNLVVAQCLANHR